MYVQSFISSKTILFSSLSLYLSFAYKQSGEQVAGPRSIGKIIEVDCPVGEPPVFIRDCDIMHDFFVRLKQNRVISSSSSLVSSKRRNDNGGSNNKSPLFSSFRRKK